MGGLSQYTPQIFRSNYFFTKTHRISKNSSIVKPACVIIDSRVFRFRDKILAIAEALNLEKHDEERLLGAAGFTKDGVITAPIFLEKSALTKALDELMNDPRLTPKQKQAAEQVVEVFVAWLRDQLAEKKIRV